MDAEVVSACENICRDFSWVGPATEWLRNLAIIVGVWVAYNQLNAWRRERLMTTNADVALELYNAAMETSKLLSDVRRGFEMLPPSSTFEDKVEQKIQRYHDRHEVIDGLLEKRIKAEVFLNDENLDTSIELLLKAVSKTQATLLTLRGHDGKPTGDEDTDNFYSELRRLMYELDDDEISVMQRQAMMELKDSLFPIIRLQRRL